LAREHGGQCVALPADLSQLEGVNSLAAALAARESKLDVLVNNAGASWGARLGEFPEVGWDKVMDTNVKGVFFLTQALLPALRAAGTAESPSRVINIGSVDGIGTPMFDTYSYGPSKAALHHLTRMLAARLVREHILVNAIAPGPFPTWMLSTGVGFGGKIEGDGVDWAAVGRSNPRGRVGTPEDIAGVAIFLASRAGAYTVGEIVTCDGGLLAAR
jgi:2-deoxy-D-gluconate 3-dehydrogenase